MSTLEYRDIPGFEGYRIGSDRSVWSHKRGGEWRRMSVTVRVGPRSRHEKISLSRAGENFAFPLDKLMHQAFGTGEPRGSRPPGLAAGVEFRQVPGFPDYGVGSDRSVWSCRPVGAAPTRRVRPGDACPWRRLKPSSGPDGTLRLSICRGDGRRYMVSVEALMAACFGDPADGERPAGVEFRDVPGIAGIEVGSDSSFWGRTTNLGYEVLGLRPPRRRLGVTVGRSKVPVVRIVRDGWVEEIAAARLIRLAFPPASPALPPAVEVDQVGDQAAAAVEPEPDIECRPIAGFPGYYLGSDRSVWTCFVRPAGEAIHRRVEPSAKQRKAVRVRSGFATVQLHRNARVFTRSVVKLFRETFPPPAPPPAPEPPGGPLGLGPMARGSENGRSVLDEAKVIEARRLKRKGWTYQDLVERYGVGKVALFYAITGKTWRHVPPEPPCLS